MIAIALLVLEILIALLSTAFGAVDPLQAPDPVSRLEDRLRSAYLALPRDGEGLPDSSGVRYLARRYLEAEHGLVVKGLDMAPWLSDGRNASQAAALRASELLAGASELLTSGPLLAALSPELGRGFTLHDAAEVVLALEEFVVSHDAALIRRAVELANILPVKRQGKDGSLKMSSEVETALLVYALLVSTKDADVLMGQLGPEIILRGIKDLSGLFTWEQLELIVAEAAQKVMDQIREVGAPNLGASMHILYSGMRNLRNRLYERRARGWCQRLRGVLSSMDHEGSGQVEFRQAFATQVSDWYFAETPEYLGAVGALAEKSAKGGGPGVLIPNYMSGINNCGASSGHPTMFCCPDECEADILPRLEAAAAGPRIAPKLVWAALSRLIKGDKRVTAKKRNELHSQLRALGHGLVEVHGRRLGRWLHRAFPHKCRGPAARSTPAVVDPTLLPTAWINAGNFLPTRPEDMGVIRAQLQARWGPDGTGADPRSFAARSTMSLDQELQLVHKFHEQHKAGGPPVQQALEDALNVRVLDRSPPAECLLATTLAIVLLGPLAAAVALMRRLPAEICSLLAAAAAAAGRLRPARPAAPREREGGELGAGAALCREGSRRACEAGPPATEKDESSTDSGDTESLCPGSSPWRSEHWEVARQLSAEDSDAEHEAAKVDVVVVERPTVKTAKAGRGRADANVLHPSQVWREAVPDVATTAVEANPQEAPAAAKVLPLAEAAGAGRPPRQAAFPRGFRPPPGLEPPPGLQPPFEVHPHRSNKDQSLPVPELTALERQSAEEHAPTPPHESSVPRPHRLTQQASPAV